MKEELKCVIESVASFNKKDGLIGKMVITWKVRDFVKFSHLAEIQGGTALINIETMQTDLFDEEPSQNGHDQTADIFNQNEHEDALLLESHIDDQGGAPAKTKATAN